MSQSPRTSDAWDSSLDGAPLISCVMPTYGRPDFVGESVAMFLSQDYSHKELIVFNDCPGQEFVGDLPGVRFVNCEKRFPTLGEKRNACIEAAHGSLIAVWDDDDVYLPWRLSFSLREMQLYRTSFYRAAEFWAYWGNAALHDNQSVPGWVNHPNTLFTKALWRAAGGYPARGVGEDCDLFATFHRILKQEFIKYPIDRRDRFFVMRGKSAYAHMSISGGAKPPDVSPGRRTVVPSPIADPVLRSVYDRLIARRNQCAAPTGADLSAPALSVCVTIKNRSRLIAGDRRLELFPNCVRSLADAARDCGRIELIVADFHSDDWPLAEWFSSAAGDLEHRVITVDGPFSKGRGLNIAADAARGQRLLFLDADMLVTREALRRAIEVVDGQEVWLPIFRYLDPEGELGEWEDYSVGNVALGRGLWPLVRPVPEFESWGGEDNIFADRLQEHCSAVRERFGGLTHQWHPESCRHAFYSRPAHSDFHDYRAKQIAAASETGPRVCILTMETPEISKHCVEMSANKLAYARRWRHDFLCLEKVLLADLPPHHSKIAAINRMLAAGMHEQLWWLDMDCVFTDFRTDLATLLKPDKWLAAVNESNSAPNICSGLMLIRNGPEAREFFQAVADDVTLCPNRQNPYEQDHINRVLAQRNWSGVQLCTVDELGAFSEEIWCCHRPWRQGDKTLHLAGGHSNWALRRKLFVERYEPLVLR